MKEKKKQNRSENAVNSSTPLVQCEEPIDRRAFASLALPHVTLRPLPGQPASLVNPLHDLDHLLSFAAEGYLKVAVFHPIPLTSPPLILSFIFIAQTLIS